MPRPSSVRSKLLGVFESGAQASSVTVAQRLGVSTTKAREMCQNARRAGALHPVATERVAGSDKPAVVYTRAMSSEAAALDHAWHDGLQSWMR